MSEEATTMAIMGAIDTINHRIDRVVGLYESLGVEMRDDRIRIYKNLEELTAELKKMNGSVGNQDTRLKRIEYIIESTEVLRILLNTRFGVFLANRWRWLGGLGLTGTGAAVAIVIDKVTGG